MTTDYKIPALPEVDLPTPKVIVEELESTKQRIIQVLKEFGISLKKIKVTVGHTVNTWEIIPGDGVKIKKIRGVMDDIALHLSPIGIRFVCPIPGRNSFALEIASKKPQTIPIGAMLNTNKYKDTDMALPCALGITTKGKPFVFDLTKAPHVLVAGATGQGKSTVLHSIIASLLCKKTPEDLKFVLIDPMKVEFSFYNSIQTPFLSKTRNAKSAVLTDVKDIVEALEALVQLMDDRYDLLRITGTRNIKEYNIFLENGRIDSKFYKHMPYYVVIIDEFGDLMMTAGKSFELPIARIAQLARAVGIHLVISTQRPIASIITGTIKANFPCRIALHVSSVIDSRIILDVPGAHQLIGRGDLLFCGDGAPIRIQGAYTDPMVEIVEICQQIYRQYDHDEITVLPEKRLIPKETAKVESRFSKETIVNEYTDPLFEEVARYVVSIQQGSTSMIQRRFCLGFNRAGRLMDLMEKAGIVGPATGANPRDVLIHDHMTLNAILEHLA
jgi:S-DNA-T family DNA segregation ATPase FtsK/SpoIIIE